MRHTQCGRKWEVLFSVHSLFETGSLSTDLPLLDRQGFASDGKRMEHLSEALRRRETYLSVEGRDYQFSFYLRRHNINYLTDLNQKLRS